MPKNNFALRKTESIMKVIQQKTEELRGYFEVTWSLWIFAEKEKKTNFFGAKVNPDLNKPYSGKNQHMFK